MFLFKLKKMCVLIGIFFKSLIRQAMKKKKSLKNYNVDKKYDVKCSGVNIFDWISSAGNNRL